MIIIGLTGFAGAGKDTAANYLNKKYGFAIFTLSDVLKDECKKAGIEPTKAALSTAGDQLRRKYGMDIVARRTVEKIMASGAERVIINGLRSVEEVQYVRDNFKKNQTKFVLVSLSAGREKRHERRNKENPISREEFFARDENDIRNKGLAKVVDMADRTINNNGTMADLHKNIDKLMGEIS